MSEWPTTAPPRDEMIAFAGALAERARAQVQKHFRGALSVDYKADRSPVTEVDQAVELLLREAIEQAYPDHGVVGEEFANRPSAGEFDWIIDPIDGTKAFMTGKPEFGTLIGFLRRGEPILGVLEVPALEERWLGAAGTATTINDRAAVASGPADLSQAVVAATTLDMFEPDELPRFDALSRRGRFRSFGGDCYNYGLLASGFLGLVVESGLKPFDYLPLVPIVEGAGGVMTDWEGRSLTLSASSTRVVAAANPALHRQAVELLSGPAGAPG